jgi:(E)-4-hydroxy-3-methyl-but-2-enyl pyrophosphate reductase
MVFHVDDLALLVLLDPRYLPVADVGMLMFHGYIKEAILLSDKANLAPYQLFDQFADFRKSHNFLQSLFYLQLMILASNKKKVKITVGKYSGFCFGVKRAYDLACVNSKDCDKIYVLGKLVHNDDVTKDLKKRGVAEIKSLSDATEGTVIFTAHGVGPGLYSEASERGLKIIDTTCPKVMKAQRLALNYKSKGFKILVFGDKKHKEVKAIFDWSGKKAFVFESFEELKKKKLDEKKRYCLISQTTQNIEEFKKCIGYLKKKHKKFIHFDTICPSTYDRQDEIKIQAESNDVVIVIGGRESANSRRLYEIAKKINPKTYFIENGSQIKKIWLKKAKKIAISAGASTPDWIIRKVIEIVGSYPLTRV